MEGKKVTFDGMDFSADDFAGNEIPPEFIEKTGSEEKPEEKVEEPAKPAEEDTEGGEEQKADEKDIEGFEFLTTEEPKKEEPEKEDVKSEKFDLAHELESLSGGKVKSKDDLQTLLNTVEQQRKELEDAKNSVTHSEYIKRLTEWMNGGGNAAEFHKYNSVQTDKLSNLEALKMQMKWENATLTDAQIDAVLKNKYQILDPEHEDYDEERALLAEANLEIDGNKAKKFLNEQKESLTLPEKEKPGAEDVEKNKAEAKEKFSKFMKSVQPTIDESVRGMTKLSIPISDGANYNFELKDEHKSEDIGEHVKNMLPHAIRMYPELARTKEGIEQMVQSIAADELKRRNEQQINQALMERGRSLSDLEMTRLMHNPSVLKDDKKPVADKSAVKVGSQEVEVDTLYQDLLKD